MARFMNEEEPNIHSGRVLSPSKEMKIDDLKQTTARKNDGASPTRVEEGPLGRGQASGPLPSPKISESTYVC